jgi:predicted DNA binding CopG/RHH family protein
MRLQQAQVIPDFPFAVPGLQAAEGVPLMATRRIIISLPEDLIRRAKRKAAAEGRTLTSLIEDGLRMALAEPRKATKRKRRLPLVSPATGGPMPGIDLTKFSAIQEMDDLEYVERMKDFK